ncbi:MAG: hypothetical protein WKG32_03870 [Gemmatimonadaceae bacterium]
MFGSVLPERGAAVARRAFAVAFVIALGGIALVFAVGDDVNGPLGTAAVVVVLAAFAVMFVATAIGFVLSLAAMRARWRHGTHEAVPPAPRDGARRW